MGWHSVEFLSIPPLRRVEVYVTIADWWAKYECFRFLYVPTPPGFVYYSGSYKSDGHDGDRVTAVAKMESLVMSFAAFLAACKYGHDNLSFWYPQFDNHDGGFTVSWLASLVEEAIVDWFARLTTRRGFDPVLRLLALNRSSGIDWGHCIGDELPILGYDFGTESVPNNIVTCATKRP